MVTKTQSEELRLGITDPVHGTCSLDDFLKYTSEHPIRKVPLIGRAFASDESSLLVGQNVDVRARLIDYWIQDERGLGDTLCVEFAGERSRAVFQKPFRFSFRSEQGEELQHFYESLFEGKQYLMMIFRAHQYPRFRSIQGVETPEGWVAL